MQGVKREFTSFTDVWAVLLKIMPTALQTGTQSFSLENMKRLLAYLGNPQDSFKAIHIAGTSGKSSTAYYTAALLQASGKKVGLTVSPHVDEINERVQIGLKPLSEKKFCHEFAIFLRQVEKSGLKPGFKALLTAFAYWEFARQKVDYAVVEVGMGGITDATNTLNRPDKVAVLTDIDYDHTEHLGNSIQGIASKKAGIIRPHNIVFSYEQAGEIMAVLREVARQQQAELHEVWPLKAAELPKNLPLFQRRNWYLAWSIYDYLMRRDGLPQLSAEALSNTTDTYIPGRMEVVRLGGRIFIMDGAHNAHKLATLSKSISKAYPGMKVATLFSLAQSGGGRARASMAAVSKLSDHMILTTFKLDQRMPKVAVNPRTLADYCQQLKYTDCEVVSKIDDALDSLLKRPEDILLVTGSFFLLNNVRTLLQKQR